MKYTNISCGPIMRFLRIFVFAIWALRINTAFAADVNVADMVENLSLAVPNLMRLVTALAYVMGMFFVVRAVVLLKDYGESRTAQTTDRGHLKGGLITLAVGAALLYLPTSVHVGMSTFWATPTPYAYITDQSDPWSELISACFMIIQLAGTIAFIRGLVMLNALGD